MNLRLGAYVNAEDKKLKEVTEELGLVISRTGRYRVTLFFLGDFSAKKMNRGMISIFLSGKSSGVDIDMDQKCYECPNPQCTGLLEPKHYNIVGNAFCPKCHRGFKRSELVGEMVFDATVEGWSRHLERYIRALNMDCDLLLHRLKTNQSIIAADHAARDDTRAGKLLQEARKAEEALYTMQRMVDDTSDQKMSLQRAIRSFLLA